MKKVSKFTSYVQNAKQKNDFLKDVGNTLVWNTGTKKNCTKPIFNFNNSNTAGLFTTAGWKLFLSP